MRKLALCFLAVLGFGNLSCSKDTDEYLQIVLNNPRAYLIPASVYSCKAALEGADTPDIQGKSFTIPRTRLRWYHAYNTLTLVQVRLTFNNSNFQSTKVECNIVDEELAAAGGQGGSPQIEANAERSFDYYTEFEFPCNLKCGGVSTKELSFSASGKLEFIGFMTSPEGEDQPVRASTGFTIENIQ